jgi:hypothetical protein
MTAIPAARPRPIELWDRIQAFSFDSGAATYSFWSRLAAENGWSLPFAARAISEYRRFLYLAVAAGHPVSPSDHVDQVWHLHLLYTESYWDRLCRDTLGRRLHHAPTTGGDAERAKFDDWYRNTLDSYRRVFREDPPADIWPGAEAGAGNDRFQRVNLRRCWIVPKPWAREVMS